MTTVELSWGVVEVERRGFVIPVRLGYDPAERKIYEAVVCSPVDDLGAQTDEAILDILGACSELGRQLRQRGWKVTL